MMDINVSTGAIDESWERFVDATEGSHYTQSGLWAQIKETQGWRTYHVTVKRNDVIVAGAQLLARPVKIFGWAGHVPCGLINPTEDLYLEEQLIRALQDVCRRNHIEYLAIPYWSGKNPQYLDLGEMGFWKGISGDIDKPCATCTDLTGGVDNILEVMKPSKRKQFRAAQKRGLEFKIGTRDDIDRFYRLHIVDGQRIGYSPDAIDHFYSLWDLYHQQGKIHLFFTEFEGKMINAAFTITHRDTLYGYKIGWCGEEGNRYPNEALYWGLMMWARENGYRTFDSGGIRRKYLSAVLKGRPYPPDFQHSSDYFQLQIAGELMFYPPLYETIHHPLLRGLYLFIMPFSEKFRLIKKMLRTYKSLSQSTSTHDGPQ